MDDECPYPGCLFCLMESTGESSSRRRASIARLFRELPNREEPGQVMTISGLWNAAMLRPSDNEFIDLGIFDCMAALILKGIHDRQWLASDQNIFIPYYAAHIIGSYTMMVEEFAVKAVRAQVIPALIELLKGKLTWVEQRVAVRALGHLATYDSTFSSVMQRGSEILPLTMKLASEALDMVYTQFYQRHESQRLKYHQDLLTRGLGGAGMQSRKAEEWASQLQCWSLQLINCFAFKTEYLVVICSDRKFFPRLLGMWGGLMNENSPAGIGLLRSMCRKKAGRLAVAECPELVSGLCNVARSSDDWQQMAVDCLLWLVQDPATRLEVLDHVAITLLDLAEFSTQSKRKLGALVASSLLKVPAERLRHAETKAALVGIASLQQKMEREKTLTDEELRIRHAAALLMRLEGNARLFSQDMAGAAIKYSEALEICPVRDKKDRIAMLSNRAQCHLLLGNYQAAVSDATRALCLHRKHRDSLWRRAQAYELLQQAKESLLDAIMYVIVTTQSSRTGKKQKKKKKLVPEYIEELIRKQMRATWLFRELSGRIPSPQHLQNEEEEEEEEDRSDWETGSEE